MDGCGINNAGAVAIPLARPVKRVLSLLYTGRMPSTPRKRVPLGAGPRFGFPGAGTASEVAVMKRLDLGITVVGLYTLVAFAIMLAFMP